jgi:NAD dependent epimerase/dehydratase family enzyme
LNSKCVLITGASGLIGTRLTELLLQRGYEARHLSRTQGNTVIQTFLWDIDSDWIEPGALSGVDVIIHLAGAGVADEPWTENRKQEIIDSRVKSSALLRRELGESMHAVNTFISATGIG